MSCGTADPYPVLTSVATRESYEPAGAGRLQRRCPRRDSPQPCRSDQMRLLHASAGRTRLHSARHPPATEAANREQVGAGGMAVCIHDRSARNACMSLLARHNDLICAPQLISAEGIRPRQTVDIARRAHRRRSRSVTTWLHQGQVRRTSCGLISTGGRRHDEHQRVIVNIAAGFRSDPTVAPYPSGATFGVLISSLLKAGRLVWSCGSSCPRQEQRR
jgi:hypothetical protein